MNTEKEYNLKSRYTVTQMFEGLRYIRNRINANDFMELFFPDEPFDDYHVKKWEMFRDDPCGFWCYCDFDNRKILEELVSDMIENYMGQKNG